MKNQYRQKSSNDSSYLTKQWLYDLEMRNRNLSTHTFTSDNSESTINASQSILGKMESIKRYTPRMELNESMAFQFKKGHKRSYVLQHSPVTKSPQPHSGMAILMCERAVSNQPAPAPITNGISNCSWRIAF